MANIRTGRPNSNSNLKVPPLKIVLGSHQQNPVAANDVNSQPEGRLDPSEMAYSGQTGSEPKEPSYRNNLDSHSNEADRQATPRRASKAALDEREAEPERQAAELEKQAPNDQASSSDDSSTTTTSPSSESESLDSNLTIISENQPARCSNNNVNTKSDQKEHNASSKQERVSRWCGVKASFSDKTSSSQSSSSSAGKPRNLESNLEQANESTAAAAATTTSNTNQRITRSSQRAAQQNKLDNPADMNGDEASIAESQSVRKAKRRKGEQQENEQDGEQQAAPPALLMANICPADYKLPSKNSFELYGDIRKRPYKKLMKLNHVQPKVPYGFKDYLLNRGPYLLDGNKLGSGWSGRGSDDRSYVIPKPLEAPKNLKPSSPLHELFKDQEGARLQMRMKHLKERERCTLGAEQEILRAYNRAAIADSRQQLHLSACTYFYYQERYHYVDEKADPNKSAKPDGAPRNQDSSNLCIEGGDTTAKSAADSNGARAGHRDGRPAGLEDKTQQSGEEEKDLAEFNATVKREGAVEAKSEGYTNNVQGGGRSRSNSNDNSSDNSDAATGKEAATKDDAMQADKANVKSSEQSMLDLDKSDANDTRPDALGASRGDTTMEMSDEDLKVMNKTAFLSQLQEIDDKWAKIKGEMFKRHRNESDSLFAVQSLEWEWKAKEIGACDVRVAARIEPEFVPRVEVSKADY